ncbi:MAG: sulfotransferase family protein, partial [Ruegeria sp.]
NFLFNFTHAFLIRDPAKTITSMFRQWPDFAEGEVGFPEQRALFDLLTALNGAPPPVIDSDDLLENPHAITKKFLIPLGYHSLATP